MSSWLNTLTSFRHTVVMGNRIYSHDVFLMSDVLNVRLLCFQVNTTPVINLLVELTSVDLNWLRSDLTHSDSTKLRFLLWMSH